MKYLIVSLTACLSIMIITRSRPATWHDGIDWCTAGTCAIRLSDGMCKNFTNPCDIEKANCLLEHDPWRHWTVCQDPSECMYAAKGEIAVCKSTCPVTNCHSTEPSCGFNKHRHSCKIFWDLCELLRQACYDKRTIHADMRKCNNAGIFHPGESCQC